MGLFGKKKEDFYKLELSDFEQRINFEEDVLGVLFSAFKKYGFPLLEEPNFEDYDGWQEFVRYNCAEDIRGIVEIFEGVLIITIYKETTSSISEDTLISALQEFFYSLLSKSAFKFYAETNIKGHYVKWEKFYPEKIHRKFT